MNLFYKPIPSLIVTNFNNKKEDFVKAMESVNDFFRQIFFYTQKYHYHLQKSKSSVFHCK